VELVEYLHGLESRRKRLLNQRMLRGRRDCLVWEEEEELKGD